MKKLAKKFTGYNVATFIVMGVGLILFLLTPLLVRLFHFDSDMLGFLIFLIGLAMWVGGLFVKKDRGNKQER